MGKVQSSAALRGQKNRPAVIVSNDAANHNLARVVVPMRSNTE
ncbi:MAG: type II toxin-antitoxin system PemK/MazF family toxin [Limnohabitans sp.]